MQLLYKLCIGSYKILYFFIKLLFFFFKKKYCFSILFHHIVHAMVHDWKLRENKTFVGSSGRNCFRFPRTVLPPVFSSNIGEGYRKKTKMRWHNTNGGL